MPGKLGRTSEQRIAILRNQASCLLWYGKIETTKARAKELRLTSKRSSPTAINTYDDTIESRRSSPKRRAKRSAKSPSPSSKTARRSSPHAAGS